MSSLFSDTTYEFFRQDPTNSYKSKGVKCLQKLEKEWLIDQGLYLKLYPGAAVPCIHGLPKIHKEDAPLRPIVYSINSVTYNIATILSPLLGYTPHHIKNSVDFTPKISQIKLEARETIVSYDVTTPFTCIPTGDAMQAVKKKLLHDNNLTKKRLVNDS